MSIYDHFRSDEKPFVEKIMDWCELVSERHQPRVTDFLDPRERFIVQSIVGQSLDLKAESFGGYEEAERQRIIICPDYFEVSRDQFQVALLSVTYDATDKIEHRDLLGSLLGLGIKREKIGDLLLADEDAQCVVAEEMADYIDLHLQQVGRTKVSTSHVNLDEIRIPEEEWVIKSSTVSSLRLDVLISEMIRLSRSKAVQLIKSGRVKVNWKVTEQPALTVEEGDMLSVKGFGRYLFKEIYGKTKKDKIRVAYGYKK